MYCYPDVRSLNIAESQYRDLPWRDFWLKRIKELDKLKEYNQNTLSELLHKTEPFLDLYREKVLQIEEKLKNLLPIINDLIKNIKEDYLIPATIRGTPSNPLNILFLVWTHFIRDSDEVHVQTLFGLLRWFSKRIKGSYHGKEMNIYFKEEDIEDYHLNKELYRYRKDELKSPKEKVVRYKRRFLVPVEKRWLEKSIKRTTEPKVPLIIFSNGERLTISDYLNNKLSPDSVPSNKKSHSSPLICLDFKSLNQNSESWHWQLELVKYIDEME